MSHVGYLFLPLIKRFVRSRSMGSLPQLEGELEAEGLDDKVSIHRDKWGVPHIFAGNMKDALFAQGFVHAQDRLWQMEFNRRLASGTLSEIVGASALDTDRICRTLGFRRLGTKDMQGVQPEILEELSAYVRGVNHCIKVQQKNLPVEFRLLGVKPAEWVPEDLAAISRFFNFNMSFAWQSKLIFQKIAEKVKPSQASELRIRYPEDHPVSIPEIEINQFLKDGRLKAFKGPYLKAVSGSNAWSVNRSKSKTGNAVLCNDPHLPLISPSFWYENHVEGGELRVHGVSIPGMPLIKIGHNADIAWGMTLSFVDVKDLYIEKFIDDRTGSYEYEGERLESEVYEEEIKIKGRSKPHVERVFVTRHGPVISEMLGEKSYKLALADQSLRETGYVEGWYRLNKAADWDSFTDAVKHLETPSLNVLYADRHGNNGHWVSGKVPRRKQQNNHLPMEGWVSDNDWEGFIPFEEMPHAFNPKRGFSLSCNHKLVDDDYPHYLGDFWMNGYRADRLEELLEERDKLELRDFTRMQMDQFCKPGLLLAEKYVGLSSPNLRTIEIKNILTKWDGVLDEDSIAGSVYQVVKQMLFRNVIEAELGDQLTRLWKGGGLKPPMFAVSDYLGHDINSMLRMLDNTESWWIQKAGGREEVLIRALEDAIDWLTERFGSDQSEWTWGKLHGLIMPHAFGQQKPMEKIFNIGPIHIGGDTDTLFQTAFLPAQPYGGETGAPVYRQIIDMGDFDNSMSVLTPGQSGNLMSGHYDDQLYMWKEGRYKKMLWSRPLVEEHAVNTLNLKPSLRMSENPDPRLD